MAKTTLITTPAIPLIVYLTSLLFIHGISSLQLADEEAGSEEAHTLGKDVLRHDVDQRRDEDESHGGLVDEEEGDELRHGGLEDGLQGVSGSLYWQIPIAIPSAEASSGPGSG
jgi:hypothetical protein